MRRRVAITGLGAVTPLGNRVKDTWRGLCEGKSGVGPISIFDASTFPTRIAGEVKGFDFTGRGDLARSSHFALEAALEAFRDAGSPAVKDPSRCGIYFGAGDSGFDFKQYAEVMLGSVNGDSAVDGSKYLTSAKSRIRPDIAREQEIHQVLNHLSRLFDAAGPVSNCLTACAASSQAIGEAAQIIRRGDAEVMISGGSHSMIHPLGLAGFNLLTALSTRNESPGLASRPFDADRDGFVLAEGAAVLILEDWEHAAKRGARVYAEVTGYGATADAFRLTDPHPEGRGAVQAMRRALQDAGLDPRAIGYINAHGTSTQTNDQIETHAVKQVFGAQARQIPMSSNKSMLGHMIAAAGATELIASVLTVRDGVLPPTINYRHPDPACDLDYVPNEARKKKVKHVLSNSFGFGGQNISLIVSKC
ncbi:MAG: beta-ketoacyl-[acyl-carrier-protein] synthase II [Omnitrophica bacterium RIFCSPHIGHO2_02_FULL_63_14]|nr:MAG: beta-ketoacyl-[acyl-carrier-protein] synthase II [Omnitrophica bacterium RIFCSPHIGHO2_02_FULL_63_14]